jgi:hypothetical protein
MNFRKLQDGVQVYELEESIELIVKTRAPAKWLLIDRETGEQYIGATPKEGELHWNRVPDSEMWRYAMESNNE